MLTYIINLAILIGINAILAVTLNFILGYAGIFSLAHAIFFGIGAYTAAVAGSLFAFFLAFINVESFVLEVSVQIIAMVIIGGTGTLLGPVIGAVIVLLLPALLTYLPYLPPTEIGSIQQMIYGLAMVLLMIFRPSGLWGYGSSQERKRATP